MFINMELEQQLIGALIWNNAALLDLEIEEKDFYWPEHQELFKRMWELYTEKYNFIVADFGSDYLADVASGVALPTTENIKSYAQQVRELSRKRSVLEAIEAARQELINTDSSSVIAALQSSLVENLDTGDLKTGEEIYMEIVAELDAAPKCYPTGLERLDKAMSGGLYAGFTYGLAGGEKSGKTTFAHTISRNLTLAKTKHLYIALEMGAKQIEQKNLARDMEINSLRFLDSRDKIKGNIHNATPSRYTIYLDAPGASLDDILTKVGIARIKHGITGFILDYWQLVEGKDHRETDEKHLRTVAQTLANYARKHNLWCILLAQMNKEGDLFGGGGLRKACDQLYFIEKNEGTDNHRWLRMGASRYTLQVDVGGEGGPAFMINKSSGPFVVSL